MDERIYDLIFICRPATPEEEVNKIVATLEHSTGEHGGKIEKTEKMGHAPPRLSRGETPRRLFRLHGREEHAGRPDQGTRAAAESFRRRHQVSDHPPRRRIEAPAETRQASRAPRQPPPAQASARRAARRRNSSSKFPQPPPNKQRPANRFLQGKETRCPINRHHQHHRKHRTLVPAPLLAPRGGTHRRTSSPLRRPFRRRRRTAPRRRRPRRTRRTGRRSRRPAPRRKAPVFPQEESLPLLRRARGLHRLQESRDAPAVRAGARQDSAPPHDRHLLAPPALARRSHQARAQHRALAVRDGTVKKEKTFNTENTEEETEERISRISIASH